MIRVLFCFFSDVALPFSDVTLNEHTSNIKVNVNEFVRRIIAQPTISCS